MNMFNKKIGPILLKEESYMDTYISEMLKLKSNASDSFKEQIDDKLKLIKWGKKGEDSITYQLKSSGLDMYILHDIYYESKLINAQIDFLVITRKHIYVIESKYLSGNIEIDSMGNFKRTNIKNNSGPTGIESPVTQNEKHLLVLNELINENREKLIPKILLNPKIKNRFKPLVVLSNPKMYLETKDADIKIKNQVVRADRIIAYITENDAASKNKTLSNKDMYELSRFFLNKGILKKSRSEENYIKSLQQFRTAYDNEKKKYEEELKKRLYEYRKEKINQENKPGYLIFKNVDIDNLIKYKPTTIEELLSIPGFGKVRANDYGEDILKILNS